MAPPGAYTAMSRNQRLGRIEGQIMQMQTQTESQSSTYSKLLAIKLDEKTRVEKTHAKSGIIGKAISIIKSIFAGH